MRIKEHSFWQHIDFWKRALKLELKNRFAETEDHKSEGEDHKPKTLSETKDTSARAASGLMAKRRLMGQKANPFEASKFSQDGSKVSKAAIASRREEATKEFVLQWCIAAVHRMLYFGVGHDSVLRCVNELADEHSLADAQCKTLSQFFESTTAAMALLSSEHA